MSLAQAAGRARSGGHGGEPHGAIGITIKLLTDTATEVQVIATGSSAFELSSRVEEPLTGRKREFRLFPFSLTELSQMYSPLEVGRILERCLIFGLYPEVINAPETAETALREIARSYLYKDVLAVQQIRNVEALERVVQSLALQVGSQVSYNELARQVGVDKKTIASYLRILEQAFIIFRLGSFSRNLRNELKRSRKIYFLDTGIRKRGDQQSQSAGAAWRCRRPVGVKRRAARPQDQVAREAHEDPVRIQRGLPWLSGHPGQS